MTMMMMIPSVASWRTLWLMLVLLTSSTAQQRAPTNSNSRLWSLTSHGGGGYAGRAVYDPDQRALLVSGTVWNSQFLHHWTNTNNNEQQQQEVVEAQGNTIDPQCFVASIPVPPSDDLSLEQTMNFRTLARPSSCSDLVLWPHKSNSNATSMAALLMGYELMTNFSDPNQTVRVAQAMTPVPVPNLDDNYHLMLSSNNDDNRKFEGRPSLYYSIGHDNDDELDIIHNYDDDDYAHLARAFTYSTAVVHHENSFFVGLTQMDKVPHFFQRASLSRQSHSDGHEPLLYYKRALQMDWLLWGHSHYLIKQLAQHTPAVGGVQKLDAATGQLDWYTNITGEPGFEGDGVWVTAVAYAAGTRYGDFVLVAGSTRGGSGPLLGTNGGRPVRGVPQDWDGFVTKLQPDTGHRAVPASGVDASHRIQSVPAAQDWVTALCLQGPDTAYVLGTTTGRVAAGMSDDGGAFVVRLDIDDMHVDWTWQLPGVGVLATACAVADSFLYLAGVLPPRHAGWDLDGNIRNDTTNNAGANSQNAFVAALRVDSGRAQIAWIHQVAFNDHHNRRRPLLHTNANNTRRESISSLSLQDGLVIAYGNARDTEKLENDIFVVALDAETGGDRTRRRPTQQPTPAPTSPSFPVAPLAPTPTHPNAQDNINIHDVDDYVLPVGLLVGAIVVPVGLVLLGAALVLLCGRRRNDESTEHSSLMTPGVQGAVADPDPIGVNREIV